MRGHRDGSHRHSRTARRCRRPLQREDPEKSVIAVGFCGLSGGQRWSGGCLDGARQACHLQGRSSCVTPSCRTPGPAVGIRIASSALLTVRARSVLGAAGVGVDGAERAEPVTVGDISVRRRTCPTSRRPSRYTSASSHIRPSHTASPCPHRGSGIGSALVVGCARRGSHPEDAGASEFVDERQASDVGGTTMVKVSSQVTGAPRGARDPAKHTRGVGAS